MENMKKRVFCLAMILILVLLPAVAYFGCGTEVHATDVISEDDMIDDGFASPGKEYPVEGYFKIATNNTLVKLVVSTTYESKGTLKLAYKDKEDSPYSISFETKKENVYDSEGSGKQLIYCIKTIVLDKGDYSITSTFENATSYNVYMVRCAGISNKKVEVVEGFSDKFELTDSIASYHEWRSLNSAVATVDDKGTVTGKYPGKASVVVTGRAESGAELFSYTLQVKVIDNVLKASKLTVSELKDKGMEIGADVYSMYYDNKGNLVMKLVVANASKKLVKKIKNVKFKAHDNGGKVIGVYKKAQIDIKVPSGKAKVLTIKIKKKELKNKKANLVGGSISGSKFIAVTV